MAPGEQIVLAHNDMINETDKTQVSFPPATLKPDEICTEISLAPAEVNLVEQDMTFTSGEMLNLKIEQPSHTVSGATGVNTDIAGFQMGGLALNMAQVPTLQVGRNI